MLLIKILKTNLERNKKQINNFKPIQNRKLIEVNSAHDYSFRTPQFIIQNNSNTNNTTSNIIDNNYSQNNKLENEELYMSNPEDWKDTIFSGEGEIPWSVGETKFRGN